jgi:manganese/zinc/iron transport system permease protein
MAAAVGINVAAMHYPLMGMVSVTTVGAFESVGAILVVAMLIAPGATAYLLTDRLERMLGLAVLVGAAASLFGYLLSRWLNCSPAGAMAGISGALFTLAFLLSPGHGVVTRLVAQRRLRRRVAEEDVLLWAGRRLETNAAAAFTAREVSQAQEWLPADTTPVLKRLTRSGMLLVHGDSFELTEAGRPHALELLRRHRLYESYLDELGYPGDHLHDAADRVEHHLSPALTAAMDAATRHPARDPQGKPIPPERG